MDFFIILLSPYLINNNSYRFKNYIAFIYSLKKLSETRRTNLSNTKEFTRSSTFNNKLENGLCNKTLINTRELSSWLGKIMFAYLKRLWWDCVLWLWCRWKSRIMRNYRFPRSAIERWNNEPCLSIFQGSRMQAGDRLGREAAARSVDEILVSCADTYRSIRTLILIYSVWFHDARFFDWKSSFARSNRCLHDRVMWDFLKKYGEEKSWKSKGIYELEWSLCKGYLAQVMAWKRSRG